MHVNSPFLDECKSSPSIVQPPDGRMVVGPSDGLSGCNEKGMPPPPFNGDGYQAVGARGHRLVDVPLLLLVPAWCGDDK